MQPAGSFLTLANRFRCYVEGKPNRPCCQGHYDAEEKRFETIFTLRFCLDESLAQRPETRCRGRRLSFWANGHNGGPARRSRRVEAPISQRRPAAVEFSRARLAHATRLLDLECSFHVCSRTEFESCAIERCEFGKPTASYVWRGPSKDLGPTRMVDSY